MPARKSSAADISPFAPFLGIVRNRLSIVDVRGVPVDELRVFVAVLDVEENANVQPSCFAQCAQNVVSVVPVGVQRHGAAYGGQVRRVEGGQNLRVAPPEVRTPPDQSEMLSS